MPICWILVSFWLQALLKNFLYIKNIHTRYLKGPPGLGLYNGKNIIAIQRINNFLLNKTFITLPKCGIWKSLLYIIFQKSLWRLLTIPNECVNHSELLSWNHLPLKFFDDENFENLHMKLRASEILTITSPTHPVKVSTIRKKKN